MSDKAIEEGRSRGSDALNELNAAGEHIKRSASYAGQAAKDSMYTTKEEGRAAVHSFKDESQQLKRQAGNELDRFASEHHLKEGEHSPEYVLSHDHHQGHFVNTDSASSSTASDANKAAFTAAAKFKEAKETISNDVRKAADYMKEEKDKLINTAREHNPMVHEKISADKTKPNWETNLENHAKEVVHDTSTLVEKDTNKVKEVWDDKTHKFKESAADMKERANEIKNKAESKVEGSMGAAKENYNESVNKINSRRGSLEEKFAQPNVTTEGEGKSFWGGLFGSSSDKPAPTKPEKHQTTYDYDTPDRFTGNPMVLEKRSPNEKTKPDWETSLEEHAQEYTHDTTTLVDKDTDKVKKGVWDAKLKTNNPKTPIHGESRGVNILHKVEDEAAHVVEEIEEESSSVWSSLFGKSKSTKEEAEIKWNDAILMANDVKHDADSTWEDAKDRVSSEANRVNRNVSSTVDDLSDKSRNVASNIEDEGARLTHQASDRAEYEKDRLHGSLNDMHKEVSANAEKWKKEGEQNVRSWYEKGTEQVRSGFNTVKNVADQDVQWVEEKVQDGVQGLKSSLSGTKEEMDRMLGRRNDKEEGLRGHVVSGERFAEEEEGLLRPTRSNIKLKPASVVVEEAHGRDI